MLAIDSYYFSLSRGKVDPLINYTSKEDLDKDHNKQLQLSYFKGLEGLSSNDRERWEQEYMHLISGEDEYTKDEIYKNTVFKQLFSNREDDWGKDIYARKNELTSEERDKYVSMALLNNIDKYEAGEIDSYGDPIAEEDRETQKSRGKLGDLKTSATNFLVETSRPIASKIRQELDALDVNEKTSLLNNFDEMSYEMSNYYRMYNTEGGKLDLTDEQKLDLYSEMLAQKELLGEEVGNKFAYRVLNEYYQNIVAENQTWTEKLWNSGAQFIDSAAGMLIRAVGMLGALTTIGLEEGEGYWENVIDNAVTRYGDRVATTNSYSIEEQKRLEELGLSDNQILNTVDQERSVLSMNTPFELLGQYGFTTASTILSLGGSSLIKGASWAGKTAATAAGVNKAVTTANKASRGIALSKWGARAEDFGNILVAGGVGTVEGGMNAAQTKKTMLDSKTKEINDKYNNFSVEDTFSMVSSTPEVTANTLVSLGLLSKEEAKPEGENGTYTKKQLEEMSNLLKSNEDALNLVLNTNKNDELKLAEDAANKAMKINFIGNSFINGIANVTLKSTLQSSSVQKTLSKVGLGNSPLDSKGVGIKKLGVGWGAQAEKYTVKHALWNKTKEALGEGFEEYFQELSDAYAQGYVTSAYDAYMSNRYGGGDMEEAVSNDFGEYVSTGLKYMGERATSQQAFKSFLYGSLSTFLGGANVNSNITNGTRNKKISENAGWFEKLAHKSPIVWRTGLSPIYDRREINAINAEREGLAKEMNSWLAQAGNQESIFNVINDAKWVKAMETAAANKDEKALRDTRLGAMYSHVVTLNHTKGSGYYDSVMKSLETRSNLKEENLDDENSLESQLVHQFQQETQNRGEEISNEDALKAIKSNASKMLDVIKQTEKETEKIESLYGRSLDRDVKAGMVFQRIVSQDSEKRMKSIEEDLNTVKQTILQDPESSESNTSKGAKKLIATYGNLDNANSASSKLSSSVEQLEETLESAEELKKNATTPGERDFANMFYATVKNDLAEAKRELSELEKQIDEYHDAIEVTTDESGEHVLESTNPVLTALDIINLDAESRANMLDPRSRNTFSAEQQQEIDKVNQIGAQAFSDFDSKIQDSGRLNLTHRLALIEQLEMMRNPDFFISKANIVKKLAQKRVAKEQLRYIMDYEDGTSETSPSYEDFYFEVKNIMDSDNTVNKEALHELLTESKSKYYERYKDDKKTKEGLYKHLDEKQNTAYNELDETSKKLFNDVLDYLLTQPGYTSLEEDGSLKEGSIDIRDIEKAKEELLANIEDTDDSYLKDWLQRYTGLETMPELESILSMYDSVMGEYNKYLEEQESNNKPIEVGEPREGQENPVAPTDGKTDEERAQEPKPVNTTPSQVEVGTAFLQSIGSSTPEGGHLDSNGNPINVENDSKKEVSDNSEEQGTESNEDDHPIIKHFASNNTDSNAVSAMRFAVRIVENDPNFSREVKDAALKMFEEVQGTTYDSMDDFIDEINKRANALAISAGDDKVKTNTATLIRSALAKAESGVFKLNSKATTSTSTSTTQSQQESKQDTQQASNVNIRGQYISSVNIYNVRRKNPDGAIAKYYDQHNIEGALENISLGQGTEIYFITDTNLTASVMAEMGAKYDANLDLPIVAVVKSEQGTITLAGVEGKYQPIGIMPSNPRNDQNDYRGSGHMIGIRNQAQQNDSTGFIVDEDGNPFVTTHYGETPKYKNVDAKAKTGEAVKQVAEGNKGVIQLGINDASNSERSQIQHLHGESLRKNSIYKKIKNAFLKGITTVKYKKKNKAEHIQMAYQQKSKNNSNENPIFIFIRDISRSHGRNTDKTFDQIASTSTNNEDIIKYNSRTHKAANAFKAFLESDDFKNLELSFSERGTLDANSFKALSDLARKLETSINNYISKPSNWNYSISYVGQNKENPEVADLEIKLIDYFSSEKEITLGRIHQNMLESMTEDEISSMQVDFLKNLILDRGNIRKDGDDDFAKWGVSYNTLNKEGVDLNKEDISSVYDDDVLEANALSLKYHLEYISLNPVKGKNTPQTPPTQKEVANASNATTGPSINDPATEGQITVGKKVIDTDAGAIVGEEDSNKNNISTVNNSAKERASEIVEQIIEDTKKMGLSSDSRYYENTKTGRKNARVTSLTGNQKDPKTQSAIDKVLSHVATSIGNGCDEVVRDIFAGLLHKNADGEWVYTKKETNGDETKVYEEKKIDSIYPNMNINLLKAFADSVNSLRLSLLEKNLTVEARDISASGNVTIRDRNNNGHELPTRGTLDLLAYDDNGDFYIYDMKTTYGGLTKDELVHYSEQLSLYKDLLENKYGIKVKGLYIIPIKVDYNIPGRAGINYITSETPAEQLPKNMPTNKNQLMAYNESEGTQHAKTYKAVKASIENPQPVEYTELSVAWESLPEDVRALETHPEMSSTVVENNNTTSVEATPQEQKVEVSDPATPPVDMGSGFNYFRSNTASDLFNTGMSGTERQNIPPATNPTETSDIPTRNKKLLWDALDSDTREALQESEVTKAMWEDMSDPERENEIRCALG